MPCVAPFFGGQGYLIIFDSLIISRLLIEKIYLKVGSGGWLHKGKVLSPFMFVVLYENLSTLFLLFVL